MRRLVGQGGLCQAVGGGRCKAVGGRGGRRSKPAKTSSKRASRSARSRGDRGQADLYQQASKAAARDRATLPYGR